MTAFHFLLLVCACCCSHASARSFCNDSAFTLVWDDEFDDPVLNTTRWTVLDATAEGDPSCGQARCMSSNVAIDGGMLRLTAQKEASGWAQYTTGAVETRDKAAWKAPPGGAWRMCMLVALPGGSGGTGAGFAPAARLLPNDDSCVPDHGVLDIMEQLNGGNTLYTTYRTAPAGAPACSNMSVSEEGSIGDEFADEYNEYAIQVNGDGGFYFMINNNYIYGHNDSYPTHLVPWFLNLNLNIGAERAGPPNASTVFPAAVNIDWVRVVASSSASIASF